MGAFGSLAPGQFGSAAVSRKIAVHHAHATKKATEASWSGISGQMVPPTPSGETAPSAAPGDLAAPYHALLDESSKPGAD